MYHLTSASAETICLHYLKTVWGIHHLNIWSTVDSTEPVTYWMTPHFLWRMWPTPVAMNLFQFSQRPLSSNMGLHLPLTENSSMKTILCPTLNSTDL